MSRLVTTGRLRSCRLDSLMSGLMSGLASGLVSGRVLGRVLPLVAASVLALADAPARAGDGTERAEPSPRGSVLDQMPPQAPMVDGRDDVQVEAETEQGPAAPTDQGEPTSESSTTIESEAQPPVPATSSEPSAPVEQALGEETNEPVEAVGATGPAEAPEVAGAAESTAAVGAAESAEATESAEAAESAESAESAEPTAADESRFKTLFARLRPAVRVPVRLNSTIQGQPRNRLDGYRFDTIITLPRFSGSITKWIGWQLGFFGRVTDFSQAELRVLDAVAEINLAPQLHLWAGRFTVPADRSNLSGPFFVPVWNFPGFYGDVYTIGPIAGAIGRDVGAMAWGDVGEGRFKYYAAVQSLEDPTVAPRMNGRVNVALFGREPGFYNAGGYLGKRDVVAIGGSMQYQPDGERTLADPMDPESTEVVLGDLWMASADFIAEKNFGRGGTPTLEATYYVFDRFRPYRHAFFVSAAYLFPWEIGPGQIQSGVRWQQAFPGATTGGGLAGLDVSTAYLFAGYRARAVLVYQRQRLGDGGPPWNAINLGFQFIVM